ncbi:MAG TPA: hypothetical protein VF268_06160 [Gammaproteobacteria bacterium]
MKHKISVEDQSFRSAFETCSIFPEEFNHRAHIRLAYIYLCEDELDAAYQKMRRSLQMFLNHHGVDPAKYHETMTRAWIMAVRYFMGRSSSAASADNFIESNPELLDSKIMLTHYSNEALFSDEARSVFVEPDLDPIPKHGR